MSTVLEETKQDFASTLKDFSGAPLADLEETVREVESVKTVRFAWHAWLPHNNLGSDGFRFNVQYAWLDRLVPIPLPVFPYPEILGRSSSAFALLGNIGNLDATLAEGVPSAGSQAKRKQKLQTPAESMLALHTAYGKYGMVELKSLLAADEREQATSFTLYEAVMGAARGEAELDAGRRPANLLLEDFPVWLREGARRALKHAFSKGSVDVPVYAQDKSGGKPRIVRYASRPFEESIGISDRAERLIDEVGISIAQAHEMALSPSIGILPRTREALNITTNRGQGGKTHLDNVDIWLLEQFPSFNMDTDVERARRAMQDTLESNAQSTGETNAVLAQIAQQNQQQSQQFMEFMRTVAEGQRQTNELLAASLKKTGGK